MARTAWRMVWAACATTIVAASVSAQTVAERKVLWKSVPFAILCFNDEAPASWNIYHTGKKGVLLVRLWKRYLLIDVAEEEVYDIDPQKVTAKDDNVEWSAADRPDEPIETTEWKERDVGSMQRVRFRFGKKGHFLELQIPLLVNGKPAY